MRRHSVPAGTAARDGGGVSYLSKAEASRFGNGAIIGTGWYRANSVMRYTLRVLQRVRNTMRIHFVY